MIERINFIDVNRPARIAWYDGPIFCVAMKYVRLLMCQTTNFN